MITVGIGEIIFFIFLLAIPVGVIFLQIYLSKKENKWYGFILPLVVFAISLMAIMGMVAFVEVGQSTMSQYVDGELVTTIISEGENREAIPGTVGRIIYIFILLNIPTAILLAIYKSVRNKQNRHRDVEKMSVQDL